METSLPARGNRARLLAAFPCGTTQGGRAGIGPEFRSALGPQPHTTIDSRGIHGSWGPPPRNHSIAWSDIADIDSKVRVSDESWYEYVQIKPYSGPTFRLAVPGNSSSKAVSNPDFDENLATIRNYRSQSKAISG